MFGELQDVRRAADMPARSKLSRQLVTPRTTEPSLNINKLIKEKRHFTK